ncbi:cupin domain-containing protein [Leucobacter celer]|uniref:cupin domain-containing protein n=1 Tax=Leucobacter celer TaxID=668625 RepID=UPI0009F92424|nr:cupin domain-containing protein [Leucobacter celer]
MSHEVSVERPLDHLRDSAATIFEGRVQSTALEASAVGLGVPGYLVSFLPGAYTRLHTHSADQVLIIVGGQGYVGDPEHPELVQKGDIVRIPAGMPHVHGAGDGIGFKHIALLAGDTTVLEAEFHWPPIIAVSRYENE